VFHMQPVLYCYRPRIGRIVFGRGGAKERNKCEILRVAQDDRPEARSLTSFGMTNPRSLALLGMTENRAWSG